ncbi:choice-of-anchor D domain-containing protein [Telmatobacter bradus]|uniref:choice-of-anchor D domain-containing protein n=1 Tax=Telmatobacter bradus TaxID=474953 RepID=UPI003B42C516
MLGDCVRKSYLSFCGFFCLLALAGCNAGFLVTGSLYVGPVSLQFSTMTTTVSSAQTVNVFNIGSAPIRINSIAATGTGASTFTTSSACGTVLNAGKSCTVSVAFASTTAGSYSANLVVNSNVGTEQVAMSGTATAPTPQASFSTTALGFGTVAANSSTTSAVTLTNSGTESLAVESLSVTGTNANFFTDTTSCGGILEVNASCAINVTFAPLVAGSYSATLNVPNSDSTASQSIPLSATVTPSTITIDTTAASDWKITNGVLSIDFNSSVGRIQGITMGGSSTQLVDTTNTDSHGVKGLYMDNSGFGSVTGTANYDYEPATSSTPAYLDWWVNYPSSGTTNTYTYTMHWVVTANDPGIHVYFVANHATTDSAGSIGQVQWAYRDSLTEFVNTYSVNPSVNNPVPLDTPLPSSTELFTTVTGRNVQDATWDLNGFTDLPTGWTRQFHTKYDHAGYEYLHQAHGLYGPTYGVWAVIPSHESMVAGPSKQDLFYTGNLLIMEAYSNHLDNGLTLSTAAGTASSRLFGPYYIHFNKFGQAYTSTGNTLSTPAEMYEDAVEVGNSFSSFYDSEADLVAAGYVPSGNRGTVNVSIGNVAGLGSTTTKAAWAVLSDNKTNFQFSSVGAQYWADITATGTATFSNVIPGTYRLSVYEMGQWGEMRIDNVAVTAGQTTTVSQAFVPENFGSTVFALGTPDRSSHEFLHGHDSNGYDYKNYWGSYNYWSDFSTNSGAVVYYATTVGSVTATNNLEAWNYHHWKTFDPGLYDSSNSSTDNYVNKIPSYVAGLATKSGTNGVTTPIPAWSLHFATPSNVSTYSSGYVELSVGMACNYGSYVVKLIGSSTLTRTWSYSSSTYSDCMIRSGLSGYYEWVVFEFPVSALNTTVGGDNVLSISTSQSGVMDDALRLELSTTSAAHATTGWYDYEYVPTSSGTVRSVDTSSNP